MINLGLQSTQLCCDAKARNKPAGPACKYHVLARLCVWITRVLPAAAPEGGGDLFIIFMCYIYQGLRLTLKVSSVCAHIWWWSGEGSHESS